MVFRKLEKHLQTMKLEPYLTLLTKINWKWIKGLSIRPDTTKFLEENSGEKLINIGLGNKFWSTMPKVQIMKKKINKWDYINFITSVKQMKQLTE